MIVKARTQGMAGQRSSGLAEVLCPVPALPSKCTMAHVNESIVAATPLTCILHFEQVPGASTCVANWWYDMVSNNMVHDKKGGIVEHNVKSVHIVNNDEVSALKPCVPIY